MLHAILMILLIILVALVIDRLSPGLINHMLSWLWSAFKSLFKFVVVFGIIIGIGTYVYNTYEEKKQKEITAKYEKEREEFEFKQRAEIEARQRQETLETERRRNMEIVNSLAEKEKQEKESIIESVRAEIIKTQSYNVVFAAQLTEAQAQYDKEKVNRILSNMSQNDRYIRQQQYIIDSNK